MKKNRQPRNNNPCIAIAVSTFNGNITENLLRCCRDELTEAGILPSNIRVVWVPGAFELPFAADKLARTKKYDAVICLGCVIKGETSHDQHVAKWAAMGTGQVSLNTGVPVLFGVLTPKSSTQARRRSEPGPLNRGKEVAAAALQMIEFNRSKDI